MSCSNVYTYSAGDVSLVLSGTQISGFESISVAPNPEQYRAIKGINGQHTRVKSFDTSATIRVVVHQTSFANDVLSTFFSNDWRTPTGALDVQLKDNSGRFLFNSSTGFITSPAESSFDEELGTRTWTVQCLQSRIYIGSSSKQNIFDKGISLIDRVEDTTQKIGDLVDFAVNFGKNF